MKALVHRIAAAARMATLATLTPLLEKNVIKTLSHDVPLTFSMSRAIVLGFAIAMLRQIWTIGVTGWPESTLSIAIVLALPLLAAIEHAKPADMLEVAKTLIGRFGVGSPSRWSTDDGRRMTEPSKYDDHRSDS